MAESLGTQKIKLGQTETLSYWPEDAMEAIRGET